MIISFYQFFFNTEHLPELQKTIGELGVRIKMGSVQERLSQQTALMMRFEKFMAQLGR
jgi:hypothetical protein